MRVFLAVATVIAVLDSTRAFSTLGFCGGAADLVDHVASTHQGDLLLASYKTKTFQMVAWEPKDAEKTYTCYDLDINSELNSISLEYSPPGNINIAVGSFSVEKTSTSYLDVTMTDDADDAMGHSGTNSNGHWFINYMSETDLIFQRCTGAFFIEVSAYAFTTADVSSLSDECIIDTVSNYVPREMNIQRADRTGC